MKLLWKHVVLLVAAGFLGVLSNFDRSSAPDHERSKATDAPPRPVHVLEKAVKIAAPSPSFPTEVAASSALRESRQHEALGQALAVARHRIDEIDPADPHSRGAGYFAANPGQQLRAWFSPDGVELASGVPSGAGDDEWHLGLRFKGLGGMKKTYLTEISTQDEESSARRRTDRSGSGSRTGMKASSTDFISNRHRSEGSKDSWFRWRWKAVCFRA